MTTSTGDGSAADREHQASAAGEPATSATGDLEFDEAAAGAAAGSGEAPGRGTRDPDPRFEDPNDR